MREEQCLLTLMPGYFFAIVLHIVCSRCVIGLRHINIFALRNKKATNLLKKLLWNLETIHGNLQPSKSVKCKKILTL